MPLYEYLCDSCNTRFEIRRAMQEIDAPTACPECHGEDVTRQMSHVFAVTQGEGGIPARGGGCGCGGACTCASPSG